MRNLPPLNPLRVFEAAASLESFTKAASALGMTQSAVSRQVAILEGALGAKLFRRERRGVALTELGRAYFNDISPALRRIYAATDQLVERRDGRSLRVRVYSTFASKWLIPRLPDFYSAHPGAPILLSNAVTPVDFGRDNADLAIQLGDGDWPELGKRLLFNDVIQPVCSPSLLANAGPIESADDLFRHKILHSHYRRRDWADWCAAVGATHAINETWKFPSSLLTFQAAVEGFGVAMGQIRLLADDFDDGLLTPLLDRPVERGLGYYVVWPLDLPQSRHAKAFVSWLLRETKRYRSSQE